jgi:hypothetical protein
MKTRFGESLKIKAVDSVDSQPSNTPSKEHVRYVGFEPIPDGRRLKFFVKPMGHASVEITIEIADAMFPGAPGISIQDAAPMAYEKIVERLATEHFLDPNELCLTDADVAQYINRHVTSQKRAHLRSDETDNQT